LSDAPTPASVGELGHKRLLSAGLTLRTIDVARTCAKVLLPVLALSTLLALALELGLWHRDEVTRGPFLPEGPRGSHALALRVGDRGWLACCLRSQGDSSEHPLASDLRLWIGGREMGPPHAQHLTIRMGETTGFSHWGSDYVVFALPPQVDNTAATTARVRYAVRLKRELLFALALGSVVLALLVYGKAELYGRRRLAVRVDRRALAGAATRTGWATAAWLVRSPILAMRALAWLLLAASGVFIVTSVYALATGWALPTTALIRWSAWAGWAARHEPLLPHVLLTLAALAAVASWLSPSVRGAASALRRDEAALGRVLRRWGCVLAICLFVFCLSAIWAGQARSGDVTAISIMGLVPFADAGGYFASAHDQAKDGVWNTMGLRRPVAAAFRSVLMFAGGFSYANALLLQVVLLAGAAYLAARSIAAWRGLYAGVAFFALTVIILRSFLPTFLTEPFGFFWALLAVPFFVDALRSGSRRNALIGFAMTTLGLAARPGSMFTLPALAVWCVWRFGRGLGGKIRVAVSVVAIFTTIATGDYVLQRAYGTGTRLTGSNFSYTLCGLSIGTDWGGCVQKYRDEYRKLGSEKAATDFLYGKAWENIRAHPGVLVSRLATSAWEFSDALLEILWRGYHFVDRPHPVLKMLFYGIAALGLAWILMRRRERGEAAFWALVWSATLASSAFVYFDDGRRVIAVAYPLLCTFFAVGLTGPAAMVARPSAAGRGLTRSGLIALSIAGVLAVAVPFVAHATSPARDLVRGLPPPRTNEHLVMGGRRMSGALIVADGAPRRVDIPTLSLSEFAALIDRSNVESYQGLLHPDAPPLPFGFVMTARLGKGSSYYQYIVPAEVMERRDVSAWRFTVRARHVNPSWGPYWLTVDKAEPIR
jgi:hypothetical protein